MAAADAAGSGGCRMSARERLPNRRLSESFGVECALDVRQAPQASCQRQALMTAGEHKCTPSRPDDRLAVEQEATHQLESEEILRARRLLDENVSLERRRVHSFPKRKITVARRDQQQKEF
jgi:hypothetical protein